MDDSTGIKRRKKRTESAETTGQEEGRTVEEDLAELEELLEKLEDEETPLEASFALYEKGMKLVQLCREKIDGVEKKVKQLSGDGTLEDFE